MPFFLRRSLVAGAIATLPITLFCLCLSASLLLVFGNGTALKSALSHSGLYGVFVGETLKTGQAKAGDDLPTANPEIRQIIQDAFPPSYLEAQTNHIIDSTYAWVQGKTSMLAFDVDITPARDKLVSGLTQYVTHRLDSLPACTASNPPTTDDPWTISCLPPGFDKPSAVSQVQSKITGQDSFLKDTRVNASNVKDKSGRNLQDRLSVVPKTYKQLKMLLLAMGLYSALMVALVIWCSQTVRKGIKRMAWTAVFTGITVGGTAWLFTLAAHKLIERLSSQAQNGGEVLPVHMARAMSELAGDVRTWMMRFGVSMALAGAAALVALFVLRKRGEHMEEVHSAPDTFSTRLEHEDELEKSARELTEDKK